MSEPDLSLHVELAPDSPVMAAEATFLVLSDGATTIVSASGELDLGSRVALREVLRPLMGVVVIDLAHVTFLDSSTIGEVVGAPKRLLASGGELRLRAPHDFVRQTLQTMGLADWIVG